MAKKPSNRKTQSNNSQNKSAQYGEQTVSVGIGGETHQTAADGAPVLTTQQGTPVSDDQNSLKIGARGPTVLEDFHFREKIFHFDHERIPERVVHARGFGAHGYFENYESLADVTKADLFQRRRREDSRFRAFLDRRRQQRLGRPGARCTRFRRQALYASKATGISSATTFRCSSFRMPSSFPISFMPSKQEPDRGFPQAASAHDNFWDFISLSPESMHMIMWAMSDRAIPRSFRFMEGFGVHTFRLVNAEGKSTFVKFHWKPKLGLQSVVWNEAVKINGADPDFHRRDLWNAIKAGDYPEWELGLQLFDEDFAEQFDFDVLDATKLIPEEEVPIRRVGRLVLDRCVDNFFAETEQVAFCTQNIVPGVDFSNDPLLQGRNFSYLDTQLKRLGQPNFTHIPINAPKCPFAHFQQDGHMAMINPKGTGQLRAEFLGRRRRRPRESPEKGFRSYPAEEEGEKLRVRSETFADHFSQAQAIFYQSDRNRAKSYHRCIYFRTEQSGKTRHPRAHGSATD